ncbi:hypothetical protein IWZ03DRAFT_391015 [Phyllosticta citriasiana]|uniref:Ankyrin repeat protein n=1 Tax=Phyllosticta citriasiana TaxID=595635 RepID=A0ABR1K9P1_9PEZI
MAPGQILLIKKALKFESKHPEMQKHDGRREKKQRLTRLCQASLLEDVDSIVLLLEHGADIDKEGCPDGSPLMAACSAGRLDLVDCLVRRGAKITYIYED